MFLRFWLSIKALLCRAGFKTRDSYKSVPKPEHSGITSELSLAIERYLQLSKKSL